MSRLELDPWIEGYLSYLSDVRRMSPRTVIDVRCTLRKVEASFAARQPGKPIWKRSLADFVAWLNAEREIGRSESALAKELSHLRGLLEYAWRSGRSDRNVLDGFSIQDGEPKSPPRSLTVPEARELVLASPRETADQRRSRIVILLLYGCGLRTSELCSLDVSDVTVERQEIFVRKGKGGRQRTIPVPAAVWTELLGYLTERGGKRGALLRTTVRFARISAKEVGEIVAVAAARAGVAGKVTPRTLRHSFGTHLMDAGVDLAVIASLMGHRSPNETGIYLHVLPGKKEAAVGMLSDDEEDEP